VLTESQYEDTRRHLRDSVERSVKDLARLRGEVKALSRPVRIQPRSATTVSLVGTDGGHNQRGINPFLTQFMRVVDSNDQEHTVEVVSAHETLEALWEKHQRPGINGRETPLKHLLDALDIRGPADLKRLTPLFSQPDPMKRSSSWLQVYRQITEWAVLLQLIESDYASDTLFVWDGPLRTKVFPSETFAILARRINEAISRQLVERGRKYYLVGLIKHSKVLERFRLAMALEGVLRQSFPCYVQLTGDLISEAIDWIEYLSASERLTITRAAGERVIKDVFSAGQMYFVKFGSRPSDPIWAADIWETQVNVDQQIFAYLLNDAVDGFPIPMFPQCLQLAHKYAALVDIDVDIFDLEFAKELRRALGRSAEIVDELDLQVSDPAARRYE
jgi:hypothetical protein